MSNSDNKSSDSKGIESNESEKLQEAMGDLFLFPVLIILGFLGLLMHKLLNINTVLVIGLLFYVFVMFEKQTKTVYHSSISLLPSTAESRDIEKFKNTLKFHVIIASLLTVVGLCLQVIPNQVI